jgi:pantothenate kinase-related protein Tda10
MFNSYGDDHITCHPATRVDLLRQIQDWAQQPDSKSIFSLNGVASTGKSTISRTIAEWLASQGHLLYREQFIVYRLCSLLAVQAKEYVKIP